MKAQTSSEYLILSAVIIIIALVVLSTMGGVFSTRSSTDENSRKSQLATGAIGISDIVATDVQTKLYLKNNQLQSLRITSVIVDDMLCGVSSTNTVPVGGRLIVVCPSLGEASNSVKDITININYTDLRTQGTFSYTPKTTWPALISNDISSLRTDLTAYYPLESSQNQSTTIYINDVDTENSTLYITNDGGGDFYDDGWTINIDVYAYKTVYGQKVFSTNPYSFSVTDGNSHVNTYTVSASWLPTAEADGYRLIVTSDWFDNSNGRPITLYVDTIENSLKIDGYSELQGGGSLTEGNTITPSSGSTISMDLAEDSTGNGYDAYPIQGAKITQLGKIGDSAYFDGSTYLGTTNPVPLDFDAQPFSVNAWINPSVLSGDTSYEFITLGTNIAGDGIFRIYYEGRPAQAANCYGGIIAQIARAHSTDNAKACIFGLIRTGKWQMVTGVYNQTNKNITFYFNGERVNTTTYTGDSINPTTGVLTIGAFFNGPDGHITGSIDEVGIWNRTLTPHEVSELYNNGNGLSLQ